MSWMSQRVSRTRTQLSERRLKFQFHPFIHAYSCELIDLWIAAWSQAMPVIDFEARRVWICDHIATLNDQGIDIACAFNTANGDMAGFVTVDIKSGHVDQLAVDPRYWGTGAAKALLDEAKRRSPSRLFLDVNQDNLRAVRVYEREGFRRWGEGVNATSGLKTWYYEWRV